MEMTKRKDLQNRGTLSDYTEANAETLKTAHGLTGIHKAAGEDMKIKMTPSSIKSFDVLKQTEILQA